MQMISALDYLLFPVYAILLGLVARFYNKRSNASLLHQKYFTIGFRIKVFCCLAFALFSAYLLPGDTEMYYTAGIDFKKIVLSNSNNLHFIFGDAKDFGAYYEMNNFRPENYGYISAESNLLPAKIVALFSIVSFNSYLVISLFFAIFSFVGLWHMFKVFVRIYPAQHKIIFLSFFLIPSALFWGSGVLKDTLCLGFLGIGFYNAYVFLFEKRYQVKVIAAFVICFLALYTIKSYIALAFVPSLLVWYLLHLIVTQKNKLVKAMLIVVPVMALLLFLVLGDINTIIADNAVDALATNIEATQKNYIKTTPDDGALLDYGEIVPTAQGILSIVPKALVAVLFRPFLWEAKKVTSLIASLEGLVFFILVIYTFLKRGIFRFFKILASDINILFAFFFSIIFAIAIGLNCFNLGTLVRYKIPCLPFFLLSILLILNTGKGKKQPTEVVSGAVPAN